VRASKWLIPAAIGGLAAIPIAGPLLSGGYLVWRPALYSDLVTAHLPLSTFIHDSLVRWGSLPLWNPLYLAGQPLVGDPLAGLTYPPLWLTYLWPSTAAFTLLAWLHLTWAGWGAYLLVRRLGGGEAAGFAGAAALAMAPRLWGQWGLGHVTLVFAVCWTPWLVLVARAASHDHAPPRRRLLLAGLAGALLGLIFGLDPRWVPAAGLAAGIGFLWPQVGSTPVWRDGARFGRQVLALVLASTGSAAALAWPLLTWLAGSTRPGVAAAAVEGMPLPASLLLALPSPGQWPEWNATTGLVVLTLAAVGVASGWRRAAPWLSLGLIALVLSWGPATPVYDLLGGLPGWSLLRMPGRWFLLTAFALAVLAGLGVHHIQQAWRLGNDRLVKRVMFATLGLASGLLAAVGWVSGWQQFAVNPWPLLSLAIGWTAFGWALARPLAAAQSLVLTAILAIELTCLVLGTVGVRAQPAPLPLPVRQAMPDDWGDGRVFSPTYDITQLQAAQDSIELVGGISPLQLRSSWEYLARTLGFPAEGYGVTLPPLPQGDPLQPTQLSYDLPGLGLLNVTHFVSRRQALLPDTGPQARIEAVWVETNPAARPRAWMQDGDGLSVDGDWRPVEGVEWRPNRISVAATGPGMLVVSEIDDQRWQVEVDGEPAVKTTIGGLLRGVELGPGPHQVSMVYRPWQALAGAVVSAVSWLGLALGWRRSR